MIAVGQSPREIVYSWERKLPLAWSLPPSARSIWKRSRTGVYSAWWTWATTSPSRLTSRESRTRSSFSWIL
jgi:hypothetical protein